MDVTGISIEGTHASWEYGFTSEKKDDNFLKQYEVGGKKCETLVKYSTNIIESFFNFLKYIDELMSFGNLAFLTFDMSYFPLQNDSIVQEIKNLKRSIEWFEIHLKEDVGNDVTDMSNHAKGIKSLLLSAPFNRDFEMICPPNLSYLYIDQPKLAEWQVLLDWFNIKRNDGTWATIYLVHNNRRPDWLILGMVVG